MSLRRKIGTAMSYIYEDITMGAPFLWYVVSTRIYATGSENLHIDVSIISP
jgi:hypothetical protein